MNILYISYHAETKSAIQKFINSHYPDFQLTVINLSINLTDLLTNSGPFHITILDIDNQNLVANEIYQMIIDMCGLSPFLFIGNQESQDQQITNDIKIKMMTNHFILTPINNADLTRAFSESLEWISREQVDQDIKVLNKKDLFPMKLRNFYLFETLPYDAYVEIAQGKFSRVIRKNIKYHEYILGNYARRNIKYFYLIKDDHLQFITKSIGSLNHIYTSRSLDKKKTIELHLKTILFFQQFVHQFTVNAEILTLTHNYIQSVHQLVKSTDNLGALLSQFTNANMTNAEFSVATSYIAESALMNIGWGAEITRNRIHLAAILQNIAIQNEDLLRIKNLNDPFFFELSEEDRTQFIEHPQKAVELCRYFNTFSEVEFLISEHHELPSGDGFPRQRNASAFTAISCLNILAQTLTERILNEEILHQREGNEINTYAQKNKLYILALNQLKKTFNVGNFKLSIKGLEKAFKKK